jgi:hypothetical protein
MQSSIGDSSVCTIVHVFQEIPANDPSTLLISAYSIGISIKEWSKKPIMPPKSEKQKI